MRRRSVVGGRGPQLDCGERVGAPLFQSGEQREREERERQQDARQLDRRPV